MTDRPDKNLSADMPGPYDLMWLSDAECPLIEDVGLGVGCLKVKGHREFSVPLCPAVLPLGREADPIRTRWRPHGNSPVDPPIDADPALTLENRSWRPDALRSVYKLGEQRIEQCVSVFEYGASAQLTVQGGAPLALYGQSLGPCKLFALADGLHIVENSPELRPLEYEVRFDPMPELVDVDGLALALNETSATYRPARWKLTWDTVDALTVTVSIIQDSVATRRSLAPSDVPAAQEHRTASWARYFRESIPRLCTPDERINELCDYLHYIYRSNLLKLGGLFPHPFSMPKQTFYGFWMWDSCFAVIGARWLVNRDQVWGGLLNIENVQYAPDDTAAGCVNNSCVAYGMNYFESDDPMSVRKLAMPHKVPEAHGDGSHPPVFAQALEALWAVDGDYRRMRRLLPNALAYHEWYERKRASERVPGLILARRWSDSGMDNSKRWGHQGSGIYGTSLEETWWSMPIITVDTNVMSILEMRALARMCEAVGDHERAESLWRKEKARVDLVLAAFWDEEQGFFFDLDEKTGRRTPVWVPTGLYPLILDALPEERVDRLVGHLFDTEKFWSKAPIPSLAMDDPDFRPSRSYWMGCTWMSYTVYVLRGLFRARPDAAWTLLDRVLDMLMPEGSPSVFENYNPLTGDGMDCANFSWQGMLIDVVITEMLGIRTGSDLSAGRCACPEHWTDWSIENLNFHGRAYDVRGAHRDGNWQTTFMDRTGG